MLKSAKDISKIIPLTPRQKLVIDQLKKDGFLYREETFIGQKKNRVYDNLVKRKLIEYDKELNRYLLASFVDWYLSGEMSDDDFYAIYEERCL